MLFLLIFSLIFVPYMIGNICAIKKTVKKTSVVEKYLNGMVFILSILLVLQAVFIKFKFDFGKIEKTYTTVISVLIILGILGLALCIVRKKGLKFPLKGFVKNKGSFAALILIIVQVIINVGLYNTYYENNATIETARTILQTGTIYQYGSFTGRIATYAFPLSNKLMILPVLYAWLSDLFHVDVAVVMGICVPIMTISLMYAVVVLWVKKIYPDDMQKQNRFMLLYIMLVWFGDYIQYATPFRVLHMGYSGEAILFGILLPYAFYRLKEKKYSIPMLTLFTIPALIKFDAIVVFLKDIVSYFYRVNTGGGYLLLWILAIVYLWARGKHKISLQTPCILITIAEGMTETVEQCKNNMKKYKAAPMVIVSLVVFLAGTMRILPHEISKRDNVYSIDSEEMDVLTFLEDDYVQEGKAGVPIVLAADQLNKWIRRMDVSAQPLLGYAIDGYDINWYSYEGYSDEKLAARALMNTYCNDANKEFIDTLNRVECDYYIFYKKYVLEREIDRIADGLGAKIIYDDGKYLVYSR